MATPEKTPKRPGLGWVAKLSLWAVVIALGYLYLSTLDRDTKEEMASQRADAEGAMATLTSAEEGKPDAVQQVLDTFADLTGSAEDYVSSAVSAGARGFDQLVAKIKELAGGETTAGEQASVADAEVDGTSEIAMSPSDEAGGGDQAALPPDLSSSTSETGEVQVAEVGTPHQVEPAPSVSRETPPRASGFDSHHRPLPQSPMRTMAGADSTPAVSPGHDVAAIPLAAPSPEAGLGTAQLHEAMASDADVSASVPLSDTEATVFAESLMREPTQAAQAVASSNPADAGQPGAWSGPADQLAAPGMGGSPDVTSGAAPAQAIPLMPRMPSRERQYESREGYLARMQAEYEAMRRASGRYGSVPWGAAPPVPPAPMGGIYPPAYVPAVPMPGYRAPYGYPLPGYPY